MYVCMYPLLLEHSLSHMQQVSIIANLQNYRTASAPNCAHDKEISA